MTNLVVTDTLTITECNCSPSKNSASMPVDLEETRRTADVRSPLTDDYSLVTVMDDLLGRESATCESCLKTVHHPEGGDLAEGNPFLIRELVENVYTFENQVLLCVTCANLLPDIWRANVRAKRARERAYEPTWFNYLVHWVSDPTATSVFARRVGAAVTGGITLVTGVAVVAGLLGGLTANVTTGVAWARTVVETAGMAGVRVAAHPWIACGLVAMAYTAHAVERVYFDPRGYVTRKYRPWKLLTIAGVISGVGALGMLGIKMGLMSAISLLFGFVVTIWAIGAAGVAWYIDLAIRHDLSIGIWRPARGAWMVAARVGILPGVLALTVGIPFAGVLADTATATLAAIPAVVALAFTGRRLPYDTQTRDRLLARLPEWLLAQWGSD